MDKQSSTEEIDFTLEDELSSLTVIVEGQRLYAHKEMLATWSPVFRLMFTRSFKEKDQREIELPDKRVEDFTELLHCMYPPIQPISDSNVQILLPLVEEYQILAVKKKCEEFLLTKPGSMELLITAQTYGLHQLLQKCIDQVHTRSFTELQRDPYFKRLEPDNLIHILQLRVLDLEVAIEQNRKSLGERDVRMYGVINELASGYGNFCTECKSRKVNDTCYNCLKMFREKVKAKCEDVKVYRNHNPLY
jgi:hypothetical protein